MAKEVIVLAIHGMGDTEPDFADDLTEKLSKKLDDGDWGKVYFDTVYYQPVFQQNQEAAFRRLKRQDLDWIKLRKFLLYGFSDAAGLERKAAEDNSLYEQVQQVIKEKLDLAYNFCGGPLPVVLIAHSLGCQVISSYIWDAQAANPKQGIWKNGGPSDVPKNSPQDKFRRLKSLKYLYTTGCNIPIFVAALKKEDISAIKTDKNGYSILWKNFYDEDDALGWPLRDLSDSYKAAVKRDKEVNADGGFFGKLIRGWNPMSHGGYWTDKDVIKPLAADIRSLLS